MEDASTNSPHPYALGSKVRIILVGSTAILLLLFLIDIASIIELAATMHKELVKILMEGHVLIICYGTPPGGSVNLVGFVK